MTRTTVSAAKPDKTDTGEWIDIHSHVGRLMSTLMAGGRPFSIDATSAGMTIITALSPQAVGTRDAETAAENDARERNRPGRREDHQQEDAVRPVQDQTQREPRRKKTVEKEHSWNE